MNSKTQLLKLPLLALLILLPGITAPADTHTWNGAGGDNNWNTAANWGGTAPASGDSLVDASDTIYDSMSDAHGRPNNTIKTSSDLPARCAPALVTRLAVSYLI